MRIFVTALLALGFAGCASSGPDLPDPEPIDKTKIQKPKDWEDWGPGKNPSAPTEAVKGARLNSQQIKSTFEDKVLRGCYPNGDKFAEALAANGKFYDALNNNAELGQWGTKDNQLCFRYPERASQNLPDSCFVVMKDGATYNFYMPDMSSKVASTAC